MVASDMQFASCSANFVADSFLDYFVSYAEKLSSEQYPVVKGEILKYVQLSSWNIVIYS